MPNYSNSIYDIEKAFAAIEDELISSMIRNMKRHKAEELTEGFQWEQWQAKQLEALEKYKKENAKKFSSRFSDINGSIDGLIRMARADGGMSQEIALLKAMKKGWKPKNYKGTTETVGEFFSLNDRKLNALINATTNDFTKAEHAMLRMADDQYRKVIYNAQVYANTGAGTYEKAVDMATKDFLSRGINCVQYANGARHTIQDYSEMCLRTATKRAYFVGEGEKRQEWGEPLVRVNKRGNPCPKCLPFVGKVLIDDVWSGGKSTDGDYPLMSRAMQLGLYHPRCKDGHTTYFEGISSPAEKFTRQDLEDIAVKYKQEQKQQYVKRQAEKYERLSKYSLDKENKQAYGRKEKIWKEKLDSSDKSGKIEVGTWSAEAIEKRRQDEAIIAGRKTEYAILYDNQGNKLFQKRGQKHSVSFTGKEIQQMKNGVLTHNHPLGATFSSDDINMLRVSGLSEIRAVGRDGTYVLKNTTDWHKDINSGDKIKKSYDEIQRSIKEEMEKAYISGKIAKEDYNIVYQERILDIMAEKYNLDYSMERSDLH